MGGTVALANAQAGGAVAWVVPTYRNARALWRFVEAHVGAGARLLRSEMTVRFYNKGFLSIYTADNDVGMRGEAFNLVVVDEAAQIKRETWTDVIMPTLADRQGRALLISTPKGRNWFWEEFERGKRDGVYQVSFTAPSTDNPLPAIRQAAEAARAVVSERTYRQEWLAEFVEDGAGIFRYIRELSVLEPIDPHPMSQYIIGVDWGRSHDETVCSVWDVGARQEVYLDHYTGVPFNLQYERIQALAERYNDALVIAEANNSQDAHVEQLALRGVRAMPFITNYKHKIYFVDALAGATERKDIQFQNYFDGILQMEAFEASRTPGGQLTYGAPEGVHDDVPMARVIAYSGIGNGVGLFPE